MRIFPDPTRARCTRLTLSTFISTALLVGCGTSSRTASPANTGAASAPPENERAKATLEVLEVNPPPGGVIRADTVIDAKLKLTLESGPNVNYLVVAQFSYSTPGTSSDGNFVGANYPVTASHSGVVQVRYPVGHIIKDTRLASPLRVFFLVLQPYAKEKAVGVAHTRQFEYFRE